MKKLLTPVLFALLIMGSPLFAQSSGSITLKRFTSTPTAILDFGARLITLPNTSGTFVLHVGGEGDVVGVSSGDAVLRGDFVRFPAVGGEISFAGDNSAQFTILYDRNPTTGTREASLRVRLFVTPTRFVTFRIVQEPSPPIMLTTNPPTKLTGLSNRGGSITVNVSLLGSAVSWSAAIKAGAPDDFLTLGVSTANTQTITYSKNDVLERSATVVFTALDASDAPLGSEEIILTQLSGPLVSVALAAPATQPLSSGGGSFTLDVSLIGTAMAWSASPVVGSTLEVISYDPVSLSGDLTNNTLTVNYGPNPTSGTRLGTFAFTATDGSGGFVSKANFRIEQGPSPAISVEVNRDIITPFSSEGGTLVATITLGGGATAWLAKKIGDESGAFITAFTPTRGDGTTNNTLTITYGANTTGLLRHAEIEFEATDGSTPLSTTRIRLTQLGVPPTLSFVTAPTDISSLGASGGTFTIAVTPGGSATSGDWVASVSLGDDTSVPTPDGSVVVAGFVTIDKTVSGSPTPSNTITVRYEANGGALSRDGEIKINAFAGGGSVQVLVPFRQLGLGVPELSVATRPRDISTLSSAGGDILVDVGLLGSSTGWRAVATTNPGTFLSLGSSTGVGGDGVLTITLTENTTNASRTGVVTLTPTGGVGTAVDAVLRLTQFPPAPSLSVVTGEALSPPLAHDASGTITATITLGGTATGWAATKIGDDSDEFITSFLPATGDGSTNNTLSIIYTANTKPRTPENPNRDRGARIRLVATGGVGTPEDTVLTITQLSLPQTLTLTPVSSVAADYSETVSAGASPSDVITWTAAITQNPGSFITLRTTSGSSATVDGDVLTYAVAANTGASREGVIRTTFASTIRGGTILIVDLRVTQLANTLAITDVSLQNVVAGSSVAFDPSADNLAAGTTGSVVATITLGSDLTGWTAAKEGDTGDAFITSFTATGGTTTPLVIAYSVNTGVLRSATINITPTGSSGAGDCVSADHYAVGSGADHSDFDHFVAIADRFSDDTG